MTRDIISLSVGARVGFFSFSRVTVDSRFALKKRTSKKNAATFVLTNAALNSSPLSWSSSRCLFSVLSRESERKSECYSIINNGENAEEKKAHARGERREHKRCEEKCQIVLNKRPENVRGETRETLALGEEFNRGREENHGTEHRLEAERLEIE